MSSVQSRLPRPAQGRGAAAVVANRGCESCHAVEANEWASSLHHKSDLEPTYVRSFAVEPLSFCTNCHSPEAPEAVDTNPDVSALGVGCVTCHGTVEGVLAGPSDHPANSAAHPVVRDARFATSAACASCHEFAFPQANYEEKPLLMQSTVREQAASSSREKACASCHMPEREGHRDHRFRSSREPDLVRSAVTVSARRLDGGHVELTLTPRGIGHAFPTGDLFRRLEITVEALGGDNLVLSEDVRYLARHFENEPQGFHDVKRLVRDDRVGLDGDSPSVISLDAGPLAAGKPIAYRVTYQRVEVPRSVDDRDAVIDGEIVLAQGALPP